jgi:hypothetical protein
VRHKLFAFGQRSITIVIALAMTTHVVGQECNQGQCVNVGIDGTSDCWSLVSTTCTATLGTPSFQATAPPTAVPWGANLICDACESEQDGGPIHYAHSWETGFQVCFSYSASVTVTASAGWASASGSVTTGGSLCYDTRETQTVSGDLTCAAGTMRQLAWTQISTPGNVIHSYSFSKSASWTPATPLPPLCIPISGVPLPPFTEGPYLCGSGSKSMPHTQLTYQATFTDLTCPDDDGGDDDGDDDDGDDDGDGNGDGWPGSMSWQDFLGMMESLFGIDLSHCLNGQPDPGDDDDHPQIRFLYSQAELDVLSPEERQNVLLVGEIGVIDDDFSMDCEQWWALYQLLYGGGGRVRFRLTPAGLDIDGIVGILFENAEITVDP